MHTAIVTKIVISIKYTFWLLFLAVTVVIWVKKYILLTILTILILVKILKSLPLNLGNIL